MHCLFAYTVHAINISCGIARSGREVAMFLFLYYPTKRRINLIDCCVILITFQPEAITAKVKVKLIANSSPLSTAAQYTNISCIIKYSVEIRQQFSKHDIYKLKNDIFVCWILYIEDVTYIWTDVKPSMNIFIKEKVIH